MTHLDGGQWTEPVRVTEPVGFSHHVYGLDAYNGGVLAAGHCFDVEQVPSRSHRVEVVSVPLRERGLNGRDGSRGFPGCTRASIRWMRWS